MTEVEVHEFIVQIFKSVAVKTDSKLTYIKMKWGWSSAELCEECVGPEQCWNRPEQHQPNLTPCYGGK